MEQISLLDYLSIVTKCSYISDLRMKEKEKEILRVINDIPTEQYSFDEWKDAYQYISGLKCCIEDQNEIKEMLIQYLK